MINWTVRINNKLFWMAIIPAILLIVQTFADVIGYSIDLGDVGNKILKLVEAVFVVLSLLGIVTDHTTAGFSDSEQAMTYSKPKE